MLPNHGLQIQIIFLYLLRIKGINIGLFLQVVHIKLSWQEDKAVLFMGLKTGQSSVVQGHIVRRMLH